MLIHLNSGNSFGFRPPAIMPWCWQQATNEAHLLAAYEHLMLGLINNAGRWRKSGVGIFQQQALIHIATPASQIPRLMADLLNWLATTDYHPLISSCVFHYEFEFIHPFSDSNGRL